MTMTSSPVPAVSSATLLDRMSRLHSLKMDLSLERIQKLLRALNNPEKKLPPVIHVAGTNGKGSVIAFMQAILQSQGYTVHAYTSPHLVRFHERICVGGVSISEKDLIDVLEQVEQANAGQSITFFEATTVAALLVFSQVSADAVLLETGLGGRLDATNVIEKPLACVLTPVSLDHQRFLGNTLEQIGREKAGIIKPGVPVISANQEAIVEHVIVDCTNSLHAPLWRSGHEWQWTKIQERFQVKTLRGLRFLPAPKLAGDHQYTNAALAVATLDIAWPQKLSSQAIAQGISRASWPGRLQLLKRHPLSGQLKEGWELWIDGAHNQAGSKALARQIEQWKDKPVFLIAGLSASRDPALFLAPFSSLIKTVWTVPIPKTDNSHRWQTIDSVAKRLGIRAKKNQSVKEALQDIVCQAQRPSRIIIAGSLYLIGHILSQDTTF